MTMAEKEPVTLPVEVPAHLMQTTRQGWPVLWGMAELTQYANLVADALGKPRLRQGRVWTWDRIEGFPAPFATLMGGSVYVADELIPFIVERLSADRFRTSPITPELRAAILADRGYMSTTASARKHNVSQSTVARAWRA